VLEGASTSDNIFFRLCPATLLVPMVLLATVATIIASQSIITGAFSMTRQAIQLGWLPRLQITQTSAEGYGQIYVGPVNWLLMIVTVGLAIGFGKSDNLAAAYGIAVSATMLMTAALLFHAMRSGIGLPPQPRGWCLPGGRCRLWRNMLKVLEGGYVPLVLAHSSMGSCRSGIGALRRSAPGCRKRSCRRCVRMRDHCGENRACQEPRCS
jgi:KUP system potassium uptake protein